MGQFCAHPNNRFGIVSHFQYKADFVLVPIQCLHLQYLHPNRPLGFMGLNYFCKGKDQVAFIPHDD
jgi:hypothetical protein